MATLYDPTVVINNRQYYFKPNTFSYIGGLGETSVEALSGGGGTITTAHSEDVSTKVSHVKGMLDLNRTNIENIEALKNLIGLCVITVHEKDFQKVFVNMSMTNDPENAFKVNPELPVEFKGNPVI